MIIEEEDSLCTEQIIIYIKGIGDGEGNDLGSGFGSGCGDGDGSKTGYGGGSGDGDGDGFLSGDGNGEQAFRH
jgi:hypothetical protein